MDIFNMFMGGGGGGGGGMENHPMSGFMNLGGLGGFGGMPGMPGMPGGGPRIIIRTFGPNQGGNGDGFNENVMGDLNDILMGMGGMGGLGGMGGMFKSHKFAEEVVIIITQHHILHTRIRLRLHLHTKRCSSNHIYNTHIIRALIFKELQGFKNQRL